MIMFLMGAVSLSLTLFSFSFFFFFSGKETY